TREGTVAVIDFMPIRTAVPDLVRIVVGRKGAVRMRAEIVIRFDYGSIVPWVTHIDGGIQAIAGPDLLRLVTPAPLRGENMKTLSEFVVREGETVPFVLTWSPSHRPMPQCIDAAQALAETEAGWRTWSAQCSYRGDHSDVVLRSLLTLKALTYAPTGGIVAAVTTSLPEQLGGIRNWDYRYCWLRDATFTLYSLMTAGYVDEARAWRDWLLRAIAGDPAKLQILYGVVGDRRIVEAEIPWLPGYEGATPVRIGNAAFEQRQLDVYGEVMDALHLSQRVGIQGIDAAWSLQRKLLDYLEGAWAEPDEGIWEVRGPRRHFTHSKVMAWVALDRAVRTVEQFGAEGPIDRWRRTRAEIHESVCRGGYDASLGSFVQYFGSKELDASLLMIPLVGFLPPHDPRVAGTVRAIEGGLMRDGFLARYATNPHIDGLPAGEGAFLACSFWLADNYVLLGRRADAQAMFDRLVALCNDVGLLSEQYDPVSKRLLGNFPQAFSHVALVNTAFNLARAEGPAQHRKIR
ncbi:MAG TPA: glycoside hydrolase family 15 protein, partial [Polyangiaceae bacterium]|nr:glycoside hydrolase family 15 protein [Polyangiaceae bacterium]